MEFIEPIETKRTGFLTKNEARPSEMVTSGVVNGVTIKRLRDAIPVHCFKPNVFWSLIYLFRDIAYSVLLIIAYFQIMKYTSEEPYQHLKSPLVLLQSWCQGVVWAGIWVIAHECGHSAFSSSSLLNDIVGWTLHSALLNPYFSWKSTHRRHHIYANNLSKDHNYVPPVASSYASALGVKLEELANLGEDAPVVLFIRIILQQAIGWNWYILTNITASLGAQLKPGMSAWRQSHFDPWGSLFRDSEVWSIILSDIGCLLTIMGNIWLYKYLGSFEHVFWLYITAWTFVNHWSVMITYLHHTHLSVPKYTNENWTFILGALATIDRDLVSSIPHYYSREATEAIKPLLGKHYHGKGGFGWAELKLAFSKCQYVTEDVERNEDLFGNAKGDASWYRGGISPAVEMNARDSVVVVEIKD